jgi:tetratricopeptide (TPR) repeat protein
VTETGGTGQGRKGAGHTAAGLAALAALAILSAEPAINAQQKGLTGGRQLARVYDAILDARFEQVPNLLKQTCPDSAPAETCQLLDVVSLWWRIQLDPKNPVHDETFRSRADASIEAIEAWTAKEPTRGEAWFYLGGAYGARAQWRVLREERLSAARDGKRIKNALERALDLDPSLQDAYFGIGLYHYYADVAPAALRMLRWLLLLPGGDRVQGLQEMLRARSGGQLLQSEADYQLHLIYLWYEKQPQRALQLLRDLQSRHPGNPLFPQLTADVQDVYVHDLHASLRTWQTLLEAARARRVAEPAMTEAAARLGAATILDRLGDTESALPHLQAIVHTKPSAPYGAVARAHLQLGRSLDHLGRRDEALAAYRAALDAVPEGDPDKIARAARAGLRTAHALPRAK